MTDIDVVFFGSQWVEQMLDRSLRADPAIEIAASTDNNAELFDFLQARQPQLLVLEYTPEHPNLLLLVRQIRTHFPRVKLAILAHNTDVSQVRELISGGISGYLTLESALDELGASIRLMSGGKLILSAEITHALLAAD
ncbi:MAG TPA: hypothetical protein VHD90_01585 [Phototrophicaceae bacterium]|nr:hypothetical protein [Phototrophicaceae bacterium]